MSFEKEAKEIIDIIGNNGNGDKEAVKKLSSYLLELCISYHEWARVI